MQAWASGPSPGATPRVSVSEEGDWRSVELLLRNDAIRSHVRIAGPLASYFLQPSTSICRCRMRAESGPCSSAIACLRPSIAIPSRCWP